MKRFLLLLLAASLALCVYASATPYYKAKSLPESASETEAAEIASIPVTFDLTSIQQAYVTMGFYSDVNHTKELSSITLKDSSGSGKIDSFTTDVYAYCRIVSTMPIVINIYGSSAMTTSAQTSDNAFNWQVYSTDGADKTVYFNGLNGSYISAKNVPLLKHDPITTKKLSSTANVKLSVESDDYRGKAIGDYSAKLYMVISSIN